ncbi:uncharacterized protein LOC142333371 [Lycorma delicatula]|uniref:uncharacterized protein LOC142333371 n=1 Tax=Lycorma delicatula TaxID=130591 RepID=UPI003F51423B
MSESKSKKQPKPKWVRRTVEVAEVRTDDSSASSGDEESQAGTCTQYWDPADRHLEVWEKILQFSEHSWYCYWWYNRDYTNESGEAIVGFVLQHDLEVFSVSGELPTYSGREDDLTLCSCHLLSVGISIYTYTTSVLSSFYLSDVSYTLAFVLFGCVLHIQFFNISLFFVPRKKSKKRVTFTYDDIVCNPIYNCQVSPDSRYYTENELRERELKNIPKEKPLCPEDNNTSDFIRTPSTETSSSKINFLTDTTASPVHSKLNLQQISQQNMLETQQSQQIPLHTSSMTSQQQTMNEQMPPMISTPQQLPYPSVCMMNGQMLNGQMPPMICVPQQLPYPSMCMNNGQILNAQMLPMINMPQQLPYPSVGMMNGQMLNGQILPMISMPQQLPYPTMGMSQQYPCPPGGPPPKECIVSQCCLVPPPTPSPSCVTFDSGPPPKECIVSQCCLIPPPPPPEKSIKSQCCLIPPPSPLPPCGTSELLSKQTSSANTRSSTSSITQQPPKGPSSKNFVNRSFAKDGDLSGVKNSPAYYSSGLHPLSFPAENNKKQNRSISLSKKPLNQLNLSRTSSSLTSITQQPPKGPSSKPCANRPCAKDGHLNGIKNSQTYCSSGLHPLPFPAVNNKKQNRSISSEKPLNQLNLSRTSSSLTSITQQPPKGPSSKPCENEPPAKDGHLNGIKNSQAYCSSGLHRLPFPAVNNQIQYGSVLLPESLTSITQQPPQEPSSKPCANRPCAKHGDLNGEKAYCSNFLSRLPFYALKQQKQKKSESLSEKPLNLSRMSSSLTSITQQPPQEPSSDPSAKDGNLNGIKNSQAYCSSGLHRLPFPAVNNQKQYGSVLLPEKPLNLSRTSSSLTSITQEPPQEPSSKPCTHRPCVKNGDLNGEKDSLRYCSSGLHQLPFPALNNQKQNGSIPLQKKPLKPLKPLHLSRTSPSGRSDPSVINPKFMEYLTLPKKKDPEMLCPPNIHILRIADHERFAALMEKYPLMFKEQIVNECCCTRKNGLVCGNGTEIPNNGKEFSTLTEGACAVCEDENECASAFDYLNNEECGCIPGEDYELCENENADENGNECQFEENPRSNNGNGCSSMKGPSVCPVCRNGYENDDECESPFEFLDHGNGHNSVDNECEVCDSEYQSPFEFLECGNCPCHSNEVYKNLCETLNGKKNENEDECDLEGNSFF